MKNSGLQNRILKNQNFEIFKLKYWDSESGIWKVEFLKFIISRNWISKISTIKNQFLKNQGSKIKIQEIGVQKFNLQKGNFWKI